MFSALLNYVNSLFASTPPAANSVYGYRWQAGAGVPATLSAYDLGAGVASGLYVVFTLNALDIDIDPFGRGAGAPGPVFTAPAVPSAAMTALITRMRANPPPGGAEYFNDATQVRLADLTGFLAYTDTCLSILNATAAGSALLTQVSSAPFPVIISPAAIGGNSTFAGGTGYVNTLTSAIRNFQGGAAMPVPALTAMINAKYAAIGGTLAKYNRLAADLNALPLYSLFVDQAAFQPNFLFQQFRFNGLRMTGQNLFNWLSTGGFASFDLNLRTFSASIQSVLVREYFLLALDIVLYPNAPPGAGTSANIKFNVIDEEDNVLGSAQFRPPAIGLAHELMHAMHYTRGTAPGYDIYSFTTTAAELLFAGIGPFAAEPITENAVRGQYAGIGAGIVDASNVWAAPALRTTYEPPVLPQTAATLRTAMRCI